MVSLDPVYFDSQSLLEVPGLAIIKTDPFRPPERVLTTFPIAQANKSVNTSAFDRLRKLHVICEIGRDDGKAGFEQSFRILQGLLRGRNKTLRFKQAGVWTDYYGATMRNAAVDDQMGGYGKIDIEFECTDPYGYETSARTLYNYPALVGGAYSFAVDFDGNIPQAPIITIHINSLLGGSNEAITVGNPETGQSVSLVSDWQAGQTLVIDCRTGYVTIDGEVVGFDGNTPEWDPEPGAITYADTIAHRNFSISITYQKRDA